MHIRFLICFLLAVALYAGATPAAGGWQPLPPPDIAKTGPRSFSDDELDLPFYLAHFHRLADSVVRKGSAFTP